MSVDLGYDKKIESLINQLTEVRQQDKSQFDSIVYSKKKKFIPFDQRIDEKKVVLPRLTQEEKELMYSDIKKQFRMAWKSPGYTNTFFNKVPPLKPCILSAWDAQRTVEPERVYKYPKGYKGFKIDSNCKEFVNHDLVLYPKSFQEHLSTQQLKFQDFLLRPSRHGKIPIDAKFEKLRLTNKEPFHLINSAQSNTFGFDKHLTFEAEMSMKSWKKSTNNNFYSTDKSFNRIQPKRHYQQ